MQSIPINDKEAGLMEEAFKVWDDAFRFQIKADTGLEGDRFNCVMEAMVYYSQLSKHWLEHIAYN